MDMTFFKSFDGETRRIKSRNEIFMKLVGTQNLFTEIQQKQLKWFIQ
jgi:hypothetical protein